MRFITQNCQVATEIFARHTFRRPGLLYGERRGGRETSAPVGGMMRQVSSAPEAKTSMPKTMAYKFCKQRTMILVHGKDPPSEEEWKVYIQDASTMRDRIKGFLVLSEGGGPNTMQRTELNEVMEVEKRGQKTAVVTLNRVARGIVTAMGWFNPGIKAFSTIQIPAALEYLGVPPNEVDEHVMELKKLKLALGIPV